HDCPLRDQSCSARNDNEVGCHTIMQGSTDEHFSSTESHYDTRRSRLNHRRALRARRSKKPPPELTLGLCTAADRACNRYLAARVVAGGCPSPAAGLCA